MIDRAEDEDRELEPGTQWPFAAAPSAELETIRRDHIEAETDIRQLGLVILAITVLVVISVLYSAITIVPERGASAVAFYLILLVPLALLAKGAERLRKLDPSASNAISALIALWPTYEIFAGAARPLDGSGSGLIRVAIAVAVVTIPLWVLWNPRARTVVSRHYRDVVIPATGHVRHATRPLSRALGVVALGVVVAAVIFFATR